MKYLAIFLLFWGCSKGITEPPIQPSSHSLKYEWYLDQSQDNKVIYTGQDGTNVYVFPSNAHIGVSGSATITVKSGHFSLVVEGQRADTPGIYVTVRATIYLDGVKVSEKTAIDHTHIVVSIGVDVS